MTVDDAHIPAEDGPAKALAPRWQDAGFLAFLLGPPIGLVLVSLALGAGAVGGDSIGMIAIFGLPVAYGVFGVPAFVGGALFGVWSAYAGNVLLSIAGGGVIGFVVTTACTAILPGQFSGVAPGWVGAVAGTLCAIWLEVRWAARPASP